MEEKRGKGVLSRKADSSPFNSSLLCMCCVFQSLSSLFSCILVVYVESCGVSFHFVVVNIRLWILNFNLLHYIKLYINKTFCVFYIDYGVQYLRDLTVFSFFILRIFHLFQVFIVFSYKFAILYLFSLTKIWKINMCHY